MFMTINESSSAPLLKALLSSIKQALDEIGEFWKFEDVTSTPMDNARVAENLQMMLQPESE